MKAENKIEIFNFDLLSANLIIKVQLLKYKYSLIQIYIILSIKSMYLV